MAPRLDFQDVLVTILGSPNVYFQPPPDIQMEYPCIVYERDDQETAYADNKTYMYMKKYQVTVIDPNPDSPIPDTLETSLPYCRFSRFFIADKLNHDVFDIYF